MKDVRMSTCKLSLMNDHTVSEVDSTTNSIEHETMKHAQNRHILHSLNTMRQGY